jgi:hypothetical protein
MENNEVEIKELEITMNWVKVRDKSSRRMLEINGICPDCGGRIEIRNPTGHCDHLQYPEFKEIVDEDKELQKRTILKVEYLLKHVEIECEENNEEDIREGGPATLGYDFYVDSNWSDVDIKKFIKDELDKNEQEGNITVLKSNWTQNRPWSKNMISRCIKKGY